MKQPCSNCNDLYAERHSGLCRVCGPKVKTAPTTKYLLTWVDEKTKEEGAFGQIFTDLARAWVWADTFNGRDDGRIYGALEGVEVRRELEEEGE